MDKAALFQALSQFVAQQQWTYLYPVFSRRAEGISLGINLHPNQACNWQCIYCQVSGLHRGASPTINLAQLGSELASCLDWIQSQLALQGRRMQDYVSDIAFAGDGEPTTSPQFAEAMQLACTYFTQPQHPQTIRLISNGSQMHHASVQAALKSLNAIGGEVWFKLDAGNDAEMRAINDSPLPVTLHLQRLKICASLCRTWIQTAVVCQKDPQTQTKTITPTLPDYLALIQTVHSQVAGVLLYGASRPSQQLTGRHLCPLSEETLQNYATHIRAVGLTVRMYE